MPTDHRSLLLRANRLLGANLVESNLAKLEEIEHASERLLQVLAGATPRQSTLLGILAYEMKVLREEDVLHHLLEHEGIGLVDLRHYDIADEVKKGLDLGACWATWSLPFDQEEDTTFIATAYYSSPAVRTYWQKQCAGPIVWLGTTLEQLTENLERLEGGQVPANRAPAAT